MSALALAVAVILELIRLARLACGTLAKVPTFRYFSKVRTRLTCWLGNPTDIGRTVQHPVDMGETEASAYRTTEDANGLRGLSGKPVASICCPTVCDLPSLSYSRTIQGCVLDF